MGPRERRGRGGEEREGEEGGREGLALLSTYLAFP